MQRDLQLNKYFYALSFHQAIQEPVNSFIQAALGNVLSEHIILDHFIQSRDVSPY